MREGWRQRGGLRKGGGGNEGEWKGGNEGGRVGGKKREWKGGNEGERVEGRE